MIDTFWYLALVKSAYYMSIILLILSTLAFMGRVASAIKPEDESRENKKEARTFFNRWLFFTSISLFLYFWASPQIP